MSRHKGIHESEFFVSLQTLISFFKHQLKMIIKSDLQKLSLSEFGERMLRAWVEGKVLKLIS